MAGRRTHAGPLATTHSATLASNPDDSVMSHGFDRWPPWFPKDLSPCSEARVLARMEQGRTTSARSMYPVCTLYKDSTGTTRPSSEYGCGRGRRDNLARSRGAKSNVNWGP